MTTPNAAISFTQLNDIGANLANTNILPVVGIGPGGVQTTQRTTIGNIANLIFSTGVVANAITAQTVTNAAQPNITSVGTLGNLTVSGNALFLNVNAGNSCQAVYLIGDGGNITNIPASQIVGSVAQSIVALGVAGSNVTGAVAQSNVANTVNNAVQANITGLGTLTGLDVSGDVEITGNTTSNGRVVMNLTSELEITGTPVVPATAAAISHRLPVLIDGVTYYIALTTTA